MKNVDELKNLIDFNYFSDKDPNKGHWHWSEVY